MVKRFNGSNIFQYLRGFHCHQQISNILTPRPDMEMFGIMALSEKILRFQQKIGKSPNFSIYIIVAITDSRICESLLWLKFEIMTAKNMTAA